MRVNGFDKSSPVKLFEGKILDGRNRYKAAVELGIEAYFEPIFGNPFNLAWAFNGQGGRLYNDRDAIVRRPPCAHFLTQIRRSPRYPHFSRTTRG
jgi:hypothetical protein